MSVTLQSLFRFPRRVVGSSILPALDGPLRPNRALDHAQAVLTSPKADCLVETEDGICWADGDRLRTLSGTDIAHAPGQISCLAVGADGTVVAGLREGGIAILTGTDNDRLLAGKGGLNCPTALVFVDEHRVAFANGAADRMPTEWRRNLMEGGASGSVGICDLRDGSLNVLCKDLAWPAGIALAPDDGIFVSESTRHRVIRIGAKGQGNVVMWSDIPAYPGPIQRSMEGTTWIAFPYVRNQLTEMILADDAFRKQMIGTLDEADWMTPALARRGDNAGPIQANGLWLGGNVKPWAASRTYGLVVKCDAEMRPLESFHSRADGKRHGITSVLASGGTVHVTSRATGEVLRLGDG